MKDKKLVACKVQIVYPEINNWKSTVFNTLAQSNTQLDLLEEHRKKSLNILKCNFYKIINKVVDSGGFYIPSAISLKFENYLIPKEIIVNIPEEFYDEFSKLPYIKSIVSLIN